MAATLIKDLPTSEEGELIITSFVAHRPAVPQATFYVTIDKSSPVPRPFYADLHVHSEDTVGNNDTAYNLSYGRDLAGLDVLGYTANDFQITESRWNKAVEVIGAFNEDDRYVLREETNDQASGL